MPRCTPPKTVALMTLGCDKNTVDAERILGELHEGGYEPFDLLTLSSKPKRDAAVDVLLVNTCSFIGPARNESMSAIRKAVELKSKGRVGRVGIAGCFAQVLHEGLPPDLAGKVDFYIGAGDIPETVAIVEGRSEAHFRPPARSMRPGPRLLSSSSTTAFVKVAEGCDRACAFCTIPRFRGKFRSRPVKQILEEIRALAGAGIREVVLVSQDTVRYGRDRRSTLADLLRRIDRVAAPSAIRVRVHYLYPTDVDRNLIDAIADSASIAPYFDIPIQHASPRVLRVMRRPPDTERIERLVEAIRSRCVESAIRTTVITGHPGETKEDFKRLLSFIRRVQFDRLGAMPYSPEPGTPAFRLRAPSGAEERAREVMAIQAKISHKLLSRRVGRTYDVLMDRDGSGRSALEAPDVDGVIHVPGRAGEMLSVRIDSVDDHDLFGSVVA